MPQNFSITHFNPPPRLSHLTWLDLYLSTNETSPRRPNARLTGRINKIKETLKFIEWKIDIRRQLVALTENNGAYCTTCSRLATASYMYCSITCPLLRGCPDSWLKRDSAWICFAKRDMQLYDQLRSDVHTCGHEADKRMIIGWEVTCTDLLQRTEDSQNRYSIRLTMPPIRGLNLDWTFHGRWGKGPGIEIELAPDEAEPPVPDEMESPALNEIEPPTHDEMQVTQEQDKTESAVTSGFCFSSMFAHWMELDRRKLK